MDRKLVGIFAKRIVGVMHPNNKGMFTHTYYAGDLNHLPAIFSLFVITLMEYKFRSSKYGILKYRYLYHKIEYLNNKL